MTNAPRSLFTRLGSAATLALLASGCRDRALPVSGAAERSLTPHVVVTSSGAAAVVTLVVDVQGDIGKIGSFTGRLHFDPTRLAFDGEVPISDAALRASNPGVGEVRVAGASAGGIDVARMAEFRFRVIDPAALNTLTFDVEEIHEVSRADLAKVTRHSAPGRLIK